MFVLIGGELPVSDLGYLLHKNPARAHTFDLPFGKAHVFFPRSEDGRALAGLLLDISPVDLVRGRGRQPADEFTLGQYVNDRPYAASSFLSVAISRVFGPALSGRSKERQELAEQALPFSARIPAIACRGGEPFLRLVFEPLGYEVKAWQHPLDERFPNWGEGTHHAVEIAGRVKLQELLTHLYVLIPVLDSAKHYWVGEAEVEKLLEKGEGWLAAHPQKEAIVNRYLRYRRELTRSALDRLTEEESPDIEEEAATHAREEDDVEGPLRLWQQRIEAVTAALHEAGARRVVDLGCGEGKLLRALLEDRLVGEILGMDVSHRSLEIAAARLRLDRLPEARRERIRLIHGSLMYRDGRIAGYDAATVVEVIEHLDPPRLAAFERVVFGEARPGCVIITTPNREYNVRFEGMATGSFRHKDHRFEWTRGEFATWAARVCERFGYQARFLPVGPEDADVGPPTQMGVFTR